MTPEMRRDYERFAAAVRKDNARPNYATTMPETCMALREEWGDDRYDAVSGEYEERRVAQAEDAFESRFDPRPGSWNY